MKKQAVNGKKGRVKLFNGVDMEGVGLPPEDVFSKLKDADKSKSLIKVFENLDKEGNKIINKVYKTLSKASFDIISKDAKDIDVSSVTFELLSPLSKKKLIVIQLTEVYKKEYEKKIKGTPEEAKTSFNDYKKKEFKTLHNQLRIVKGIEVVEVLGFFSKVGMEKLVKAYMDAFIIDVINPLEEIYERVNNYTDPIEYETLKEIAIRRGVPEYIIDKIFYTTFSEDGNIIVKINEINFLTEKLKSDLMDTEVVNIGGMLDFNPHLEDLNMEIGFKFLGETKTRAIYKDKFFTMYDSLAEEGNTQKPSGYDIYSFYVNKLLGTEIQDNPKVFQHITHWELSENIQDIEVLQIANMMKRTITDFNVKFMPYKKYNKNYLNLVDGEIEYIGFFKANSSFANENLVLYRQVKTGKRYLAMALGHSIPQDIFIYFNTQISHFLKNKTFIDEAQLYADMYHRYNLMKLEDTEIFDISMMEQYKDVIKDIVWPLSLEYTRKHGKTGKPKNSLLVGVYGTSKSQTMLSLMKYKEFKLNGRKFTLNANVIAFSTMDFVRLLKDDVGIKKRLADIYQNTKIPIILLLEDIDTTTEDVMIEQAMTILMDGIGSIPITIISAVNYPNKIPHRLIRPNRLENIILYNVPLGENVVSNIMETHIAKHDLEKFLDVKILRSMVPKMEYWTPSHIGAFIKRIREHIDFETDFDEDYRISKDDLNMILRKLPVPIGDIKQKQKDIKNWYSKATNGDKDKMGF